MIIFYLFNAFLAGVSIVISRMLNANLSNKIGLIQSTFMNFLFGTLASFIIYIIASGASFQIIKTPITSILIWAYTGGLLGIGIVSLSNYVTPRISAFYLTLSLFISQLFIGVIIDYFMFNDYSTGKIIGGLIVLSGLVYNQILDNKASEDDDSVIDNQEPKGATS